MPPRSVPWRDPGVETGVMHGCGHDTHMTSWIGTARLLAARKGEWSGTLVMIAQPGEETGEGAKAMLDDGLYTRFPKPSTVIAFHDAAAIPAGVIGVTPGYALANVDSVDISVKGVGGHGAYPQTTKDPIVLAARIVTTLQTLVSRENDPANPAVVTVGSFQAGAKHNIISDEARLQLTVRSYQPEVRKLLLDGIKRIARGEAIAAGMPEDRMPVVTIREAEYTPATFNTEPLVRPCACPVRGAVRRGTRGQDPGGDGRRGFQPLLARRQGNSEPDLLGRRHPQINLGRSGWQCGQAAFTSLALLGTRS